MSKEKESWRVNNYMKVMLTDEIYISVLSKNIIYEHLSVAFPVTRIRKCIVH